MAENVTEQVEKEWKENTTAFDRVRSVISTTYDGKKVSEIADLALVSETTARSHLESLAEDGFVTVDSKNGAKVYSRSTESLVLEQAHDILEHSDREELLSKVTEMQTEIEDHRKETGIERPEDVAWTDADIDEERILKWKTTRRNLEFVKVALALNQAKDIVAEPNAV